MHPNSLNPSSIFLESDELNILKYNKQSGYNYRFRRYNDWTETYELYRDKVLYNRLTQRQSVNVPLMKQTLKVILKDVDNMPVLYFQNLDNDKQAEVFKNEYWKYTAEQNNMELQDIVDKKQVLLFGRSFDQWQIVDGKVKMTVQDTEDILVDRYTDPYNLHSARWLIHAHIFKPLSSLADNPMYDQDAVKRLQEFYSTQHGLIKAADNQKMYVERQRKMQDLGVLDAYSPLLGETIIEESLHFIYRKEKGDDVEQLYLYVEVDNMVIIMKKRLEDVIGVTSDHFWRNHFPYVSWADDVERQDFWSDGMGDVVRTPNKVLNSWFSQMVENRTLKNFTMHYFNSSLEGFNPDTYVAQPWGWYPIPVPQGQKLTDVMQDVTIPDLGDSAGEMDFIMKMSDTASGASPLQQGVPLPGRVQFAQAKLVLDQSLQRVKSMSKYYTKAWEDRGLIFTKLLEAAGDKLDAVKIYKEGKNGQDIYSREITSEDWKTKSGYKVKVWSQDDRDNQNKETIGEITNALLVFPGNPKLLDIYKRKMLELAHLSADEISSVMEVEDARQQAMVSTPGMLPQGQNGVAGLPSMPTAQPQLPQGAPGLPIAQPQNVR